MKTITHTVEEACISEHPCFTKKQAEWGVRDEYWTPEWEDMETGEYHESEFIPEDRSGHKPELDGMSMADMWDYEKGEWRIKPPGYEGITTFMRPKLIVEHGFNPTIK
jgi:hypothetical protein